MIPFILGLALAGAISSRLGIPGATGVIYRIAVIGLTWCCVGVALHVGRFYDALLAIYRSRRVPALAIAVPRWPRSSSDLDFIVQAVLAAIAAVIA
jgi:hypothetical protein